MNDDFLYQSRPPVRSEFKKSLYLRISHHDSAVEKDIRLGKAHALKWARATIVVLLFSMSITLLVSQEARAKFSFIIHSIGGFLFEETDQFPFPDHPEQDYQELPSLELGEAQDVLPFDLVLPTYLPEGYELANDIGIACEKECALVNWHNKNEDALILSVQMLENYPEWAEPVGLETVEEIFVNDQSSALIRGAWNFNEERWDENLGLRLKWEYDGLVYGLNWRPSQGVGIDERNLTAEDLVRIAETIR